MSNKNMQRGRGARRNNKSNLRGRDMISHPPQLMSTVIQHAPTLRFRTNAAVSSAITFQNLLDTYLLATTAIAGFDVFQTVKIRRVRVWTIPAVGTVSSASVEFSGTTTGLVGDQLIHTDTSMGVVPAHIDCRPSAKALASDFQVSSASIAFQLIAPIGSVVDVEVTFRGQLVVATAAQNALVGATAGAIYLRGLDGLAAAGSQFVPEYAVAVI